MPFHVDRFRISFKEITGKNAASALGIRLSEYGSLMTPREKADFIRKLMDKLISRYPKHVAERVMIECGSTMRDGVSRCISEHRIRRTRMLFEKSNGMKDFLGKLSKHGGGKLNLEGETIMATYHRCYCGSVSKVRENIPLIYCYCGAGWYKRLFEEVLGCPMRVDVVQSIASGADRCSIRIVPQAKRAKYAT